MAAAAAGRDYVAALEQELAKIQVFQRELPLSLDLVMRTIDSCRRALQEEDSEERPLQMEEFMPMRGNLLASEEEEEEEGDRGGSHQDMADWLRSAQLWNQHQQSDQTHKDAAMEAVEPPAAAVEEASDEGSDGAQGGDTGSSAEKDGGRMAKKERRSWSLDLHRRFLDALQELGGPEVATPKQIKELMNVDGLTSDEIKSHLQKHRIRSKRPAVPPATLTAGDATMSGQPQVLLGIWVPQGDYAAVAAAAAAAIASLPLEPKQKKQRKQKQQPKGGGAATAPPRNQNATSTGSNTTSL